MDPAAESRPSAHMRFEDPATFLEFCGKQLERGVVGVRYPQAVPVDTRIWIIVSPPGVPDALRLDGRVERAGARPDGSVRLRVRVDPTAGDRLWLTAYISGLRAGLGAATRPVEPAEHPTRALRGRMDRLTYYELLDATPSADRATLVARFVEALGRLRASPSPDDAAVARRLSEAYGALRDGRLRAEYDLGLAGPDRRLRLEAPDEATPAGHGLDEQYWRLARQALDRARRGRIERREAAHEALRLLRMARVFAAEPSHIEHAMKTVEALLGEGGRDQKSRL